MSPVIVYTKPRELGYCAACESTKRKLTALGVIFTEENIYAEENAHVLALAKSTGLSAAPLVVVTNEFTREEQMWAGYRPDLLANLVA